MHPLQPVSRLVAAAAAAACACLLATPLTGAELTCRPDEEFKVAVNGEHDDTAQVLLTDAPGKFLVEIPKESRTVLVDMHEKRAFAVARQDVWRTADGVVHVDDRFSWTAPTYAFTLDESSMRFNTGVSDVQLVRVTPPRPDEKLLGYAVSEPAPAPAQGKAAKKPRPEQHPLSARDCLKLVDLPVTGVPGCAKFVAVSNVCDTPVHASVVRTEILKIGRLPQTLMFDLPPGGEETLGCSWWSGAAAPASHEIGPAVYLTQPAPAPRASRPPGGTSSN